MTLQGFAKATNDKTAWVAVPLELVDWMAETFGTPFAKYLAGLAPYANVPVAEEQVSIAPGELQRVQHVLRRERCNVPSEVDLFGQYGTIGAKRTVTEMIEFFKAAKKFGWNVVSIGD